MRKNQKSVRFFKLKFGGVNPFLYFYHETRRDGERLGDKGTRRRDVARHHSPSPQHHSRDVVKKQTNEKQRFIF